MTIAIRTSFGSPIAMIGSHSAVQRNCTSEGSPLGITFGLIPSRSTIRAGQRDTTTLM